MNLPKKGGVQVGNKGQGKPAGKNGVPQKSPVKTVKK